MKEKNKDSLPLVNIIGLPIILIIATSIARIHIDVLGSPLYISVFIYPLTYLMTLITLKKTNVKNAMNIMAVSLISQSLAFVISWILLHTLDYSLMIATFISFLINQLIIIVVYDFLYEIRQDSYALLFILLLIVSIIDNVIFGNFIEESIITISILVRIIYLVMIPAIIARKITK